MADADHGGDCLCGRGPAVGTLTWTSGRMHFRAFHDGPAYWHHENSADWVCLDCVADTAARIASGEVREDMRRMAVVMLGAFGAGPATEENDGHPL